LPDRSNLFIERKDKPHPRVLPPLMPARNNSLTRLPTVD